MNEVTAYHRPYIQVKKYDTYKLCKMHYYHHYINIISSLEALVVNQNLRIASDSLNSNI